MAGATLGIPGMVEGHRRPVVDRVAVRALTRPVLIFYVARLAIQRAGMVESDAHPILSGMAICAVFSVMRQRRCGMARRAVHQARMREIDLRPGLEDMTVRALPAVMTNRRLRVMAAGATALPQVVEVGFLPVPGVMAVRALPNIVVPRRLPHMAAGALHKVAMEEDVLVPVAGVMAGEALPRIMPHRRCRPVAAAAIRVRRAVLVSRRVPGPGVVAVRALPLVMPARRVRAVTVLAIPVESMVEADRPPVVADMAVITRAVVVPAGSPMAALAFLGQSLVAEAGTGPGIGVVAGLAVLGVMVDRRFMADIAAIGHCVHVMDFFPTLSCMAGCALPAEMWLRPVQFVTAQAVLIDRMFALHLVPALDR